ncbi:MAG: hypothetical protein AB7Q23_05715 [Hyphomonadaceae bacterium]
MSMKSARGPLLAFVLVFALAACGQPQEQAKGKQDEAFPVVLAPDVNTRIGPDGAAGISNALPMDIAAIRQAAANFVVEEKAAQIEGQPYTAIALSAGDEEVFRLLPTADGRHIHAIVTTSSQARGPLQDIVGVTLFGTAPAEETEVCLAESVGGAPGFACSTAEDGRFWRVYKLPEGYDGPSDPFDAIDPDVLHDAELVEMRWIAPRVR